MGTLCLILEVEREERIEEEEEEEEEEGEDCFPVMVAGLWAGAGKVTAH